ncbi:MAG: hypothetical protein QNJ36_10840 [Calothrix sp. MO_167.B42]|nr:hypothetical protein [Calothrix sp. MO_167.B42]
MLTSKKVSNTTSFLGISNGKIELSLRPFAWLAEDLQIDFQQTRPHLETQILECCISNREGSKLDRGFFWNLEIGKRIEYLLILATLPHNSQFGVNLRCLNLECQQQMEIEFPLSSLIDLQHQSENKNPEIAFASENFSLRKPTGNDQLAWLHQVFSDESSAIMAMVQTLLPAEQKSAFQQGCSQHQDWIQTLNQVMEESDPLVNFSLQVNCPYCNTQNLQDFDLGAWALQQLYGAQQQLLVTIHRLAWHYHWSESEIFAIPPWRRSRYLDLINREENY